MKRLPVLRFWAKQWMPPVLMLAFLMEAAMAAPAATGKRTARPRKTAPTTDATESAAPHPAIRATANPSGGQSVAVNPPPLLWPIDGGRDMRYAVRLSRDPEFKRVDTILAEGVRWAMFNPHRRLEPGRWFWQYAVQKPGGPAQWSDRHEFVLESTSRLFVTPDAPAMLAACSPGHPRILAMAEELPELRRKAGGQGEFETLIARARKIAKARLPQAEKAKPAQKGTTAFQSKNFAKWASKGFAGDLAEHLTTLAPAYLLTGDESIGRAAVQRALFVAGLDPDGDTAPGVSDFADGSCMRTLALAYDSCFALLSPQERDQLRRAMAARAGRFFGKHINSLEGRIFSPHVWQHILIEATEVAFATLGELPEARTWLAYVYELWINRFPPMGGDDGGWTEGIGYLGTNLETMLVMPQRFGRLTGADLHDAPWYRNAPWFHIYGWPPGSVSAGFGDGDHDARSIGAVRAYFVETLGRRSGNAAAARYAQAVTGGKSQALPPLLAWHRLCEPAGKQAVVEPHPALPQSRAFRDVGLVAMHTDLAEAKRDVFVAFCSCPFGAYGHMHPCQNAFNLMVGGERLFANSGYYIAFGDEYFQGWYHNTRGHNTVLIDGQGQSPSSAAHGWIARHADSGAVAYCLGDASRAYGNTGLTRFRRQVALLRPATVVIYDELEADHPARWSWRLHSPAEIKADSTSARLRAATSAGRGQVDVYGSHALRVVVDDRFDPPADNWRGKKSGGQARQYPNQWHATVEPVEKAARTRFLAVIQLRLAGQPEEFVAPKVTSRGRVQVGAWTVQAALNPEEKAALLIQGADGRSLLATGVSSIFHGGQQIALTQEETILADGPNVIRTADQPGQR